LGHQPASIHNGKYISYLRVSTQKQGESGLGLEAQRKAVLDYLNGGAWELLEEFVEIESGKSHRNRLGLMKALDACRRYGAKLIISRLDRLSREPVFLLSLRDAGVDFTAVDLPNANRMTVGVMALVAEQEREAISQRTKAALAAARARGVKLGCPVPGKARFNDRSAAIAAAAKSGETRGLAADEFARLIQPLLQGALAGKSANAVASVLNERGVMTPRGGKWTARSVINVRARLEAAQ
jgi:DNA invertase Pin-like site-specific DNA recombinase